MTEYIAITIMVPHKDITTPDSVVTTMPIVAGEPIDREVETNTPELFGKEIGCYEIVGWDEEALDQLVLDRFNEEFANHG